jgi:electron-transferring-flavoprotein dehydrogenase
MMTEIQREILEVDILFVGAGPSSLAAAIRLVQRVQAHGLPMPQIAVIEKAAEVGAHQMSGAVLDPTPLAELIPDYRSKGCPIESEVTSEALYFLTAKRAFRSPFLPPPMHNGGNCVISLARFTRWLGEQASGLGINVFTGFPGVEVLYDGHRVVGVRTGDKGIDAKGERKPNFEPGVDLRARLTVFGEGVRGFLAKSLIPRLGLDRGKQPPSFETGVKEVWECLPGRVPPGLVLHTAGYPLSRDTAGGSFVYGMRENLLVIGLVVSLDYADPFLEPYRELQRLKQHPLISKFIEGGKQVAYGAKALAAGGYHAAPRLAFDGGMIVGESGQLLDLSRLKGIHAGMRSGMVAAETIFENLRDGKPFSAESLAPYEERFWASEAGRGIYRARNFHPALGRGMPWALLHLAAQQVTGGRGFIDPMPTRLDREHYRTVAERYGRADAPIPQLTDKLHAVDKLTSVFNAGTIHEENQPAHLKIRDPKRCADECVREYRAPCNRFCPAQVYEMVSGPSGQRLQVNFTNCVHCQTCDIKCPKDNILWTPPEGGGGPKYSIL